MIINRIIRESIFVLFIIYYSQGWIYPSGSIISQTSILLIILISLIYLVKVVILKDKKNNLLIAWTMFVILNLVGFVFSFDLSDVYMRDAIKNTLGCMLPFYPFYYFTIKKELNASHLLRLAILLMPIYIIQFIINENTLLFASESDSNGIVNNTSYMFISIIPYIFLIKKKWLIAVIWLAIILFFVIRGAKRGAIFAASIGLIMYFIFLLKTLGKKNRVFGYAAALLLIIGISIFTYRLVLSNELILNRMALMMGGDTSNREVLYKKILDGWYNSNNMLNFVFGYGVASSIRVTGMGLAHSDWLEVVSNFGIVGVFAYLLLFCSALKTAISNDWNIDKRILMLALIFMWFFISLISMWYTSLSYFTFSILFGFLVGDKNRNLNIIKNSSQS